MLYRQCPAHTKRPATRRHLLLLLTVTSILLGFSVALPAGALAAAGWSRQYLSATTDQLNGVALANARNGWAVGDNGVILATTDGGTSWQAQTSGTTDNLDGVAFANTRDGWAVDDSGCALATTDGGRTWSQQCLGVWGLFGVAFANSSHGWAVGGEGYTDTSIIMVTTSGGAIWIAQRWGSDESLDAVAFANASDGLAVGSTLDAAGNPNRALLLATTDGGVTWQAQSSGTTDNLNGVAFANIHDGWAVGDHGVILATTDGGATWQAQDSGATANTSFTAIAFANATDGWAVGYNETGAVILATTNGGTSWRAQSANASNFAGVACSDASHVWAAGAFGASCTIFATTNGGGGGVTTPQLTLTLTGLKSGALKLGKRLTAKGTVTPSGLAGEKVTLTVQRKQGGKWRKAKTLTCTIAVSGTYSGKYKLAKKGSYRIRASIAKTAANTAAATKWLRFKVR